MAGSSWVQVVSSLEPESSVTLSNSTSLTSLLSPQAIWNMGTSWNKIGQKMRVRAEGRISNRGTSSDTLTLALYVGALGAAIGSEALLFTYGAINISTTANTNKPWVLEGELTLKTNGSSANFEGIGTIIGPAFVSTAGQAQSAVSDGVVTIPQSNPAAGSNFNSLTALQLDLGGTWSAASASNSVQLINWEVWQLGLPIAA